ncbi:MAG: dTDP-4-dehydrorhamnose 3,5-epimerase [Bacteroidota bacterium]|nr:dTDP-4-dehydrorhamnose 3,5-epimerase [Bacteroidota bacterium]
MIFTETKLKGVFIIDVKKLEDNRGFFGRSWCEKEADEHGLATRMVQSNISLNHKKGTLRGMHFQHPPFAENKLVRCTKGVVVDIIIDLRPESLTHKQWIAVELNSTSHRMLFVPEGFGHGFQTLEDNSELFYQVSQFYAPQHASGVRYNDPAFQITWPLPVTEISPSDSSWPDYRL